MESSSQKDLFSSIISNIKCYNGDDPLRPWIQGIRKIHQSLPPHILEEKLPRLLQKCTQTFESTRRYRNDSRYLSVWIQLMDYVEDAKVLLKKMETQQIGVKRAKFYIAYSLYYEKKKKFVDAEKMYQLGVHNLAEPMGELQKSYDHFLRRMKILRHRRARAESMPSASEPTPTGNSSQKTSDLKSCQHAESNFRTDRSFCKDDAGWSGEDDACHHYGRLDSTINIKGTINDIYSMSKVSLEPETISKSLVKVKSKSNIDQCSFEVLADEEIEKSGDGNNSIVSGPPTEAGNIEMPKPFVGAFKILGDDGDDGDDDDADCMEIEEHIGGSCKYAPLAHVSTEFGTRNYGARLNEDAVIRSLKEDTVIRKILGSTVFDEPKVEDACHHGLVDPTVNLKQAMEDINGMFGKPLNFVKARKPKKQEKQLDCKPGSSNQGFFILADDDVEKDVKDEAPLRILHNPIGEGDFFEPTTFTREAMDEINDLFGRPIDF